jgi:hypothetical protein
MRILLIIFHCSINKLIILSNVRRVIFYDQYCWSCPTLFNIFQSFLFYLHLCLIKTERVITILQNRNLIHQTILTLEDTRLINIIPNRSIVIDQSLIKVFKIIGEKHINDALFSILTIQPCFLFSIFNLIPKQRINSKRTLTLILLMLKSISQFDDSKRILEFME